MKKNLTLFMVLLAAVMMTGCSSDELGEFNANGDFVVKGNNPPSKTDFLRGSGSRRITGITGLAEPPRPTLSAAIPPRGSSGSMLFLHRSFTSARCATMKPQARYISAITRLLP